MGTQKTEVRPWEGQREQLMGPEGILNQSRMMYQWGPPKMYQGSFQAPSGELTEYGIKNQLELARNSKHLLGQAGAAANEQYGPGQTLTGQGWGHHLYGSGQPQQMHNYKWGRGKAAADQDQWRGKIQGEMLTPNSPAKAYADEVAKGLQRNYEQVTAGQNKAAQVASGGGGNSSKWGIAQGLAQQGLMDAIGRERSNVMNQAYSQGLNYIGQMGANRNQAVGQALQHQQANYRGQTERGLGQGNLAVQGQGNFNSYLNALPGLTQASTIPAAMMRDAGNYWDQRAQQQRNEEIARHNYEQTKDRQNLQWWNSMVTGTPAGAQTVGQGGGGSPLMGGMTGALSGAATGAAIGTAIPVVGPGWGTAAGAIIGGIGGYASGAM